MATFTNKTKNAGVVTGKTKSSASSFNARVKAGKSWSYGEPGYTYGQITSDIGIVYYGQVGSVSITNKIKN